MFVFGAPVCVVIVVLGVGFLCLSYCGFDFMVFGSGLIVWWFDLVTLLLLFVRWCLRWGWMLIAVVSCRVCCVRYLD